MQCRNYILQFETCVLDFGDIKTIPDQSPRFWNFLLFNFISPWFLSTAGWIIFPSSALCRSIVFEISNSGLSPLLVLVLLFYWFTFQLLSSLVVIARKMPPRLPFIELSSLVEAHVSQPCAKVFWTYYIVLKGEGKPYSLSQVRPLGNLGQKVVRLGNN